MNMMLNTARFILAGYDSGTAGWKKDANGALVLNNGNPVWVDSAGQESSVDSGTISRLNGEARQHRERAEAADLKLKTFEGIDPAKARDALGIVDKLDKKKLVDAGEIDKVRAEIEKGYQERITTVTAENEKLRGTNDTMVLTHSFTGSEFYKNKVRVPQDMFQATFGKHFKIEDGKPVAYDGNGQKIYSKSKMGELADFEESLEILVNGYAHKNDILKGNLGSGSGNNGGGGNRGNGGRIYTRAEFDKLGPAEKATIAGEVRTGTAQIVENTH